MSTPMRPGVTMTCLPTTRAATERIIRYGFVCPVILASETKLESHCA
jgi:hypothetical protein